MYDCQEDRYTEFNTTPQTATPALRGTLTAHPLASAAKARLTELAAYATERQLDISLQQGTLTIDDLTLTEALNINARFGKELIISCHLRCDPPARFA